MKGDAAGRARDSVAGYAGDIDADTAWQVLSKEPHAVLIDCRTKAEWSYVGVPELDSLGKAPVLIEWQRYPDGSLNPSFAEDLARAGLGKDAKLLFICRSGQRSKAAAIAATAAGWRACFNVSGGFEGPQDAQGHRGTVDGWKARGLPWRQA